MLQVGLIPPHLNNFTILSKENNEIFKIKKGHYEPPSFLVIMGYVSSHFDFAQCDDIYLLNSSLPFSPTVTFIVSPFTKLPANNSCERGLIRYF